MDILNLKDKKIAVIMGGNSRERDVSIHSGKKVLESLKRQGFEAIELQMGRNLAFDLENSKIDVAFIALHGSGGEDGSVQGLLEVLGIPYTGSGVLSSALALNKVVSKKIWQYEKISTPPFFEIDISRNLEEQAQEIVKVLKLPLVVKPVCEGSSIGVEIVVEEKELLPVLKKSIIEFRNIFVERFVKGTEITVGLLGVGNKTRALPVLELRSKTGTYDHKAKYTKGLTEFIIPADMSDEMLEISQETALKVYKALYCSDFARVDMIVEENTAWVHDLNTIPGLTELSDLPAQAQADGISYDELVFEILSYASVNKM
ncbi:MAG: D-alanine--D-alanine ligase [Candidatus Omnitrophica bacterium]|nr:D-alanine--D-alanine ligase [Candidatus Omnitrophota bacterium]MBU1046985.1 D-alanine--D-alanine ligase [Candidatus Omnitrophota bacterium]MBU1631314.1 D-alanine--D-alanine ligase [Candidatus Omnitrophota bacterium]MBU1889531.1 D-alanine--D-alanine ligase [Candidatus Omnitrophota bacterium]